MDQPSIAYYIHFHIPGMTEDYSGRPVPSARTALIRVRRLTEKYGFRITKLQERKGKNTREISLAELEKIVKG